ncbi:MAG: amino acid permease [Proteobacteria bacterium]|nr:amino acid permease [Pseudomonadota bacterium]
MAAQKRSLGFWRTWSLSAGYMIGSGIFLMPTVLAPYDLLGLSSWLITGAGAVLLALVFGNLSRRIPKVGGPYAYTREAFGEFPGFLVAWSYWISLWVATAAITVAMTGYLGVFIPALGESFFAQVSLGLVIIALIVTLNIKSIRQTGIFQLALTILKILPLLAIGIAGLFYIDGGHVPEMNPSGGEPLSVLATASILTMWAFVGLEAATIPAGNVINPEKNIPRALILAVIAVVIIYFLSSFAVMTIVDGGTLANSEAPFADAAVLVWGEWAAYAIALGAVFSTLGALNCNVLLGGQMPMAAANKGTFPKPFSKLNKSGTPAFALVIGGILGGGLMILNYTKGFVEAFTFMILLSTLANLLAYAGSSLADLKFSLKDKTLTTGKVIKNVIVALMALAFSIFLAVGAGADVLIYGGLMLLAGIPVYMFSKQQNK